MGVAPGLGLEDGVAIFDLWRTKRKGRDSKHNRQSRDICATVKIGYRKPKQRELRLVMSCD